MTSTPFRVLVLALALAAPTGALADAESTRRVYAQPYEKVWAAAQHSCDTVGWKTKEVNAEAGVIVARTRMSLSTWGGVLNVSVAETPDGVSVAVSADTAQWMDKRKNARDLERFIQALEANVSGG